MSDNELRPLKLEVNKGEEYPQRAEELTGGRPLATRRA
jgi:hypothetical protein